MDYENISSESKSESSNCKKHFSSKLTSCLESSDMEAKSGIYSTNRYFRSNMKYFVSIMCHLGFAAECANRAVLSISIMNIANSVGGERWKPEQQGMILSAFFWGYTISLIPFGILVTLTSPRKILTFSATTNALLALLTPIVAKNLSYEFLIVLRIFVGIFQSSFCPAFYAVIQNWSTRYTKSKMVSIATGGYYLGVCFGFLLSGIADNYLSWEFPFYIIGGFGLLWSVVWLIFVTDTPESNKFISSKELQEITSYNVPVELNSKTIPWKQIWLCPRILACMITHFCQNWSQYTMLIELPSYLKNVMGFKISTSGILAALPSIANYIFLISGAQIVDHLLKRDIVTAKNARKLASCSSLLGIVIFMFIGIKFESPILAIIGFTLGFGIIGLSFSGFYTEIMEISRPYSGFVFSVSNTFGHLPGVFCPILIGYMTPNNTKNEWSNYFYLIMSFAFFGFLVYAFFPTKKNNWSKPI